MVKVTVLYGHPADPATFEKYYAETHLPLTAQMRGVHHAEFSRVIGTPEGGRPAFYRMAEIWFESPQQMDETLGSPEGQATVGDLANFATGGTTILVCEVD